MRHPISSLRWSAIAFGIVSVHAACGADPEAHSSRLSPACANNARDTAEDGIDCGGECKRCDGSACGNDGECLSQKCSAGRCAPPATKPCGAGLPSVCPDGERCGQDLDCASTYCDGRCSPPPPGVHQNGRRDAGETGVDCGGTVRAERPCGVGQPCQVNDDCASTCSAAGVCDAPGPTDSKKNGQETDVDCGGPDAPKCPVGRVCLGDDDCELAACMKGSCVVPTASDGVKNGHESDVDCGGPGVSAGGAGYLPPRCREGRTCAADSDCLTGACSPAGRCVPRSCDTAETAGILTCGAREVGDPGATHESCCKSLPLPSRTTRRLDKYEVTAGRFRTFLTAVGPDVRAWVSTYAAARPGSQLASLLEAFPTVLPIYPADLTGPRNLIAHMALDIDNYDGTRGCYNGEGSYGAGTYWLPPERLQDFGLPPRALPREVTDAKPLNCAMPIMFAAFCAWDGGELASFADLIDAWGGGTYPWGPTDIGRPGYNWCNGEPETGGFNCQDTTLGNNGIFYRFPSATNLANDMSPLIAAPGRFTPDATQLKVSGESWMDLYGNLAEYTGDFSSSTSDFCDFSATPATGATTCTRQHRSPGDIGTLFKGIPTVRMLGVSWEGHRYERTNTSVLPATFQYGKFGARCARSVESQ